VSQQEIYEILKKAYPLYLTTKEIISKANFGEISVRRCIRDLKKREEIEYMITQSNKYKGSWIYSYRAKG